MISTCIIVYPLCSLNYIDYLFYHFKYEFSMNSSATWANQQLRITFKILNIHLNSFLLDLVSAKIFFNQNDSFTGIGLKFIYCSFLKFINIFLCTPCLFFFKYVLFNINSICLSFICSLSWITLLTYFRIS